MTIIFVIIFMCIIRLLNPHTGEQKHTRLVYKNGLNKSPQMRLQNQVEMLPQRRP